MNIEFLEALVNFSKRYRLESYPVRTVIGLMMDECVLGHNFAEFYPEIVERLKPVEDEVFTIVATTCPKHLKDVKVILQSKRGVKIHYPINMLLRVNNYHYLRCNDVEYFAMILEVTKHTTYSAHWECGTLWLEEC